MHQTAISTSTTTHLYHYHPSTQSETCYTLATVHPLHEHERRILCTVLRAHDEQRILCTVLRAHDEQRILCTVLRAHDERHQPDTGTFQFNRSHLVVPDPTTHCVLETGYKLHFESPWSAHAVSILHACGLRGLRRMERTCRRVVSRHAAKRFKLADPVLEAVYTSPLTFDDGVHGVDGGVDASLPDVYRVPIADLGEFNAFYHLAMDANDLALYTRLFRDEWRRDPTNVELFDLAQSNSEHSRHWLFNGKLVRDGVALPYTLFDLVKSTLPAIPTTQPPTSVVAFADNASALRGADVSRLVVTPATNVFRVATHVMHPTFTAETHNFPTAVAPFAGAATGIGGRLRDNECIGRGGLVVAGTAGYAVGELGLHPTADNPRPYHHDSVPHDPRTVLLRASDGASDYGNTFGEPIVNGFARSYGRTHADGTRTEWLKPILFTGGVGMVDDAHVRKHSPTPSWRIVRIGGLAYRVGVGGGSASSRGGGTDGCDVVDQCAVQRGDPLMGNKLCRVVRACVECGAANPLRSLHDQGAGGMANVTKEICAPSGGCVDVAKLPLGDVTLSTLEKWTAEYQEGNVALVHPDDVARVEAICARERCPVADIGCVTGDGHITVIDSTRKAGDDHSTQPHAAVSLDLAQVLDDVPQKTYVLDDEHSTPPPSTRPQPPHQKQQDGHHIHPFTATCRTELRNVLRLLSVGSKRFLTTKVDRSVGGLVVQQQCVGYGHVPVSDYALVAHSPFGSTGTVTAIGEQPMKGLVTHTAHGSPTLAAREHAARTMAQMTVAEMVTNLMWVKLREPNTSNTRGGLHDVRCSANWMWAKDEDGETNTLVAACEAMCDTLRALGVAVDGGKDSLSMSTQVARPAQQCDEMGAQETVARETVARETVASGRETVVSGRETVVSTRETVASAGTLVLSAYAFVPDIAIRVTPQLQRAGNALYVLHTSSSATQQSTPPPSPDTGSAWALAHPAADVCQSSSGGTTTTPDPTVLRACFDCVQTAIAHEWVVAGHDVSDGGLVTTVLEMCFAADGLGVALVFDAPRQNQNDSNAADLTHAWLRNTLFDEPASVVVEVADAHEATFVHALNTSHVPHTRIGEVTQSPHVHITANTQPNTIGTYTASEPVLTATVAELFADWERTSHELERQQCTPECVMEEWHHTITRRAYPRYDTASKSNLPTARLPLTPPYNLGCRNRRVGIVRAEGSNGDREMAAAFVHAGADVVDITMDELAQVPVDALHALAFVGGFSYADVFGAGQGWWAKVAHHSPTAKWLHTFLHERTDTYTLGVCNGCQLLVKLGLFGDDVRIEKNVSGRFESRYSTVRVCTSAAASSPWLRGLDGNDMGVWVAHGEGRFVFDKNENSHSSNNACTTTDVHPRVALQYINVHQSPATPTAARMHYPSNPNGSEHAAAGVCSADGRHLAMMPHPERTVLGWQTVQGGDYSREVAREYTGWMGLFVGGISKSLLYL